MCWAERFSVCERGVCVPQHARAHGGQKRGAWGWVGGRGGWDRFRRRAVVWELAQRCVARTHATPPGAAVVFLCHPVLMAVAAPPRAMRRPRRRGRWTTLRRCRPATTARWGPPGAAHAAPRFAAAAPGALCLLRPPAASCLRLCHALQRSPWHHLNVRPLAVRAPLPCFLLVSRWSIAHHHHHPPTNKHRHTHPPPPPPYHHTHTHTRRSRTPPCCASWWTCATPTWTTSRCATTS